MLCCDEANYIIASSCLEIGLEDTGRIFAHLVSIYCNPSCGEYVIVNCRSELSAELILAFTQWNWIGEYLGSAAFVFYLRMYVSNELHRF